MAPTTNEKNNNNRLTELILSTSPRDNLQDVQHMLLEARTLPSLVDFSACGPIMDSAEIVQELCVHCRPAVMRHSNLETFWLDNDGSTTICDEEIGLKCARNKCNKFIRFLERWQTETGSLQGLAEDIDKLKWSSTEPPKSRFLVLPEDATAIEKTVYESVSNFEAFTTILYVLLRNNMRIINGSGPVNDQT